MDDLYLEDLTLLNNVIRALINENKDAFMSPVKAFVTFANQEPRERCLNTYKKSLYVSKFVSKLN